MTEQVFLDYNEFWNLVGEKRHDCIAMKDVGMMGFSAMLFDSLADEYLCKVRLKNDFHKDYKIRKKLVMMENTHLIHWSEWLDIGIIIKKHPKLMDKMMLVTSVDIVLNEPCFIDQVIPFNIEVLKEKIRDRKSVV